MPSPMQPVNIPPELRPNYKPGENPPGPRASLPLDLLLSMLGVIVGTAMLGVGVGTWVHPGAGVAAAGLVIAFVAVLIGFQV